MFLRFFVFAVTLCSVQFIALATTNTPDNTEKWELISEKEGISVFERWVTNEDNKNVRERSGKMIMYSSVNEVVDLITNTTKTKLWMSNVDNVKLLSQKNNELLIYTIFNSPWPFGKQDMVSKYSIKKSGKHTYVYIDQASSELPKQKDVTRLDTFTARWEIEDCGSHLKVTFTTRSKVPPEYPAWVQDPIVRKIFYSNLYNFKDVLQKHQITQG